MTSNRPPVLKGHSQQGKVFSPPLTQLAGLTEVSWVDDILPDFLWIGLLISAQGVRQAFRTLEGLVTSHAQLGSEATGWLSRTSTFATFGPNVEEAFIASLEESGHLVGLRSALSPLVAHYPACPLRCLFHEAPGTGDISVVRDGVAKSLNRWGEHGSWIQIAAVFTAVAQGKVHFPAGSVFADFAEVEQYPETEKSRAIASSCRALINSFPPSQHSAASREWVKYFWARGLELEPCVPVLMADDDE